MISYPSLRRLRRGTCRTWATIVLLAGLVACARAPAPGASEHEAREHGAEQTPGPFLLGGIQVNEAQLEPWLGALEAAGMNTVAVTDYAHQGDWDSANLWWDPNPGLLPEIRAAKDRGLHVVLVLRLALDRAFPRNRFLWHGMIMPASDEQLRRWFARYQTFVRAWAEVAEREGIDALMIGSELNALTSTVPVQPCQRSRTGCSMTPSNGSDAPVPWLPPIACQPSTCGKTASSRSPMSAATWMRASRLSARGHMPKQAARPSRPWPGSTPVAQRSSVTGWR